MPPSPKPNAAPMLGLSDGLREQIITNAVTLYPSKKSHRVVIATNPGDGRFHAHVLAMGLFGHYRLMSGPAADNMQDAYTNLLVLTGKELELAHRKKSFRTRLFLLLVVYFVLGDLAPMIVSKALLLFIFFVLWHLSTKNADEKDFDEEKTDTVRTWLRFLAL